MKVGLLELCLGPLSVVDVERGHIPTIDPSLIIEQWIVTDQEPAIFAVLTQHTLLGLKRHGAFERLSALLAQPIDILRVEEPRAIILSLHLLQSDAAVVLQHRFIGIEYGSISAQHVDISGNGADH